MGSSNRGCNAEGALQRLAASSDPAVVSSAFKLYDHGNKLIAIGGALSQATQDILSFYQDFAGLTGAVSDIGTGNLDLAAVDSLLDDLAGLNEALGEIESSLQGLAGAMGNDASQISIPNLKLESSDYSEDALTFFKAALSVLQREIGTATWDTSARGIEDPLIMADPMSRSESTTWRWGSGVPQMGPPALDGSAVNHPLSGAASHRVSRFSTPSHISCRHDSRRADPLPSGISTQSNRRPVMCSRQPVFLPLLVCALACALPSPVSAQQETASVTGTVRDESGAIVQKAVVTLTNVHTNTIATTRQMSPDGIDSRASGPGSIRSASSTPASHAPFLTA